MEARTGTDTVVFGFGGMVSRLVGDVAFGTVGGGVVLGGLQGVAWGGLQGLALGGLQGLALGGMPGCSAFGVLSLALGRHGRSSLGSSTFVLGRAFCLLKAAAAAFCVGLPSTFTSLGTGTPPTHT